MILVSSACSEFWINFRNSQKPSKCNLKINNSTVLTEYTQLSSSRLKKCLNSGK